MKLLTNLKILPVTFFKDHKGAILTLKMLTGSRELGSFDRWSLKREASEVFRKNPLVPPPVRALESVTAPSRTVFGN